MVPTTSTGNETTELPERWPIATGTIEPLLLRHWLRAGACLDRPVGLLLSGLVTPEITTSSGLGESKEGSQDVIARGRCRGVPRTIRAGIDRRRKLPMVGWTIRCLGQRFAATRTFNCLSFALIAVGLFLFGGGQAQAEYTQPGSYLNPALVVTLGTPGYYVAPADGTSVFQQAIDVAAGGGRVIVPRGAYELTEVKLKGAVHLVFDGHSSIGLYDAGFVANKNVNLFDLGKNSHVENVSIRGINGWSQFVIDPAGHRRVRAFLINDAENFLVSNFHVADSRTTFSGLTLGWRGENPDGSPQISVDGTVEYSRPANTHYGFGAIQAHAAYNVTFREIEAVGGVALRLETGVKDMNLAQSGDLADIHAKGLTSYRGQVALMCAPHSMHHGHMTANGLRSFGSEYALLINDGSLHKFTAEEIAHHGLTEGSYQSITVYDVEAHYSDGSIETRWVHLHHYPVELQSQLYRVPASYSDTGIADRRLCL